MVWPKTEKAFCFYTVHKVEQKSVQVYVSMQYCIYWHTNAYQQYAEASFDTVINKHRSSSA